MNPLAASSVICMLPVKDLARARRFYEEALGLEPSGPSRTASSSTAAAAPNWPCFPSRRAPRPNTRRSASGGAHREAVAALEQRGVRFADYDLPGLKTVQHVCVLGSEKAAWFEDPEGNILCLHEDLA